MSDSEVGNFDGVLISDETVTCRQIAMDQVQLLEVLHSGSDLSGQVDQAPVAMDNTCNTLH